MCKPALGLTQPPNQWAPGAISLGVKLLRCEADHPPPSIPMLRTVWSYTSTPQYVFMAWFLVRHRDNFTFTFHNIIRVIISIRYVTYEDTRIAYRIFAVRSQWSQIY
jgi:hypothetical protein